MTEDLEKVVERLAADARGEEGVEAWAERITQTSVSVYEQEVERLTSASSLGVGVRVVSGGRLGYAYTADTSAEGLDQVIAEARANLEVASEDPGNVLPAAAPVEPLEGIFDERLATTTPERKVALALDLESRTRAADARVSAVERAGYGDVLASVAVASSTGVRGSYSLTRAYGFSSALATEDGASQSGFGADARRSIEELDVAWIASEAAERAVRMLGATKPKTRTVPVIFEQETAKSLIGVLVAGLSAEAVQKRQSLFVGKLGEQVGASGLHLVDDGHLVEGSGAAPFDGEGVPTSRRVLISDGVLRGFMHNTASAVREGTTSTGNASRGSFKSTPGISPHNIYFQPGSKDLPALLAQAGEGLLVQDVSGVHSGANPITGDFSVGVSGLWFRGGELAEPVHEVTVASHLLDILKGIVAVGSDLRFTVGSVGGTSLLIGQMTVAGQ